MSDNDSRTFDTSEIAERCAEETKRFLRKESYIDANCFELFKRAILQGDVEARVLAGDIYAPLVRHWVVRSAPQLDEVDREFLVSEETDRFWINFTAEKIKRATQLAQVLAYWEICVKRTAHKYALKRSLETPIDTPGQLGELVAQDAPVPDAVDERLRHARFWEIVLSHCKDDLDRVVSRQIIIEDKKPGEVYAELQERFDSIISIDDVYGRIRNLKDRWRRDVQLRQLWVESK